MLMRMDSARALLLFMLTLFGSASLPAADARTEILAAMQTQQDDWNRGDLAGFMKGYEKSPEITFVGKTVSRGYDGLMERYQKAYADKEKMGKLTFSELEYTGLGENNAFLIGRFHLERSDAGGGNASGRFTVIFRKTADGWKIIHDHTSGD